MSKMNKVKKSKMKTKKSAVKRFKVTGTGKVLRSHQLRTSHLRRKKSKGALRRSKRVIEVGKANIRAVRRMLAI